MKTNPIRSKRQAFVLVDLLAVVALAGMLAILVLPRFARCKCKCVKINCTNNLKQVGLAFRMWSDDNGSYPMLIKTTNFDGPSFAASNRMYVYFQAMSNELSTPKVVVCPGDTTRTAGTNFFSDFGNSRVSYFVGLDAEETIPQMFLAGDRNLVTNGASESSGLLTIGTNTAIHWSQAIHKGRGNVALADGSVQSYTSSAVQQAVHHTGADVTRLVFP